MATLPQITLPHAEGDRAGQLAAAAYDLLDEYGLEGLTIRAVLARAGLARRAFYECYGGKDDLVLSVFEQTLAAAANHFRAMAEQFPEPLERLRTIVQGIVLGMVHYDQPGHRQSERRSAALAREHLRLAESRPEELQKALSPLLDLLGEQVAAGIAAGSVRTCDPALTASLIYNLVSTTTHGVLLAEEEGTPDEARREMLANSLWDFCCRAIAA